MTTIISIIVAVGLFGFICVSSVIEYGKTLNTKEDVEEYEKDACYSFCGNKIH